jgi:ATP-dependent exoDNAse (exonuclease V) beta subunit
VAQYAQALSKVRDIGFSQTAGIGACISSVAESNAGDAGSVPSETFGILCHDCVEHTIKTGSTESFAPDKKYLKDLSPIAIRQALDIAKSMASAFITSEFWSSLKIDAVVSCEKSFVLAMEDALIEGRMDLFVERGQTITIIDFKTDTIEEPWRYATQLDIYHDAAKAFAPRATIRTGILWLRTMNINWRNSLTDGESHYALIAEAIGHIRQEGTYSDILVANSYESF